MTFKYHVTCQKSRSKKVITVESKSAIVEAIKEKFEIKSGDIVVQIPYGGDDWIDVENIEDEVGESEKLAFFIKKDNADRRDVPNPNARHDDARSNIRDRINEALKRLFDDPAGVSKREYIRNYLASNQSYDRILEAALETQKDHIIIIVSNIILSHTEWQYEWDVTDLSLKPSSEESDVQQGFNHQLLLKKLFDEIKMLAPGIMSHREQEASKASPNIEMARALVALMNKFPSLAKFSPVCGVAVELIGGVYLPIHQWWKGDLSGAQCAKKVADYGAYIAGGVAGGYAGQQLVSTMFPNSDQIFSAAGGLIGMLVGAGLAFYVCDRLTQKIFNLPKSEALRNAYAYLNLPPTASNDEVNKRFRVMALGHHPDKEGGSTEKFQLLQAHVGIIKAARES